MLQFYYHPLSPIARRVWWALLEKNIPFAAHLVDLRGQQHEPDYLAINPFHHVPALIEGDFKLIESIAILDYLEARYPRPSLWPATPHAQAKLRMLQMVTVNELMPHTRDLILADEVPLSTKTADHLATVCGFYEDHLHADGPYFGGDRIDLADIVVGATVPLAQRLGLSLMAYPKLSGWCAAVRERPAWQASEPSDRDFDAWRQYIQRLVRAAQKRQASATSAPNSATQTNE